MFKVVSSDGTAIACERHGDEGPTLVLVGGTLMTRARHAPLASLLARDFSVVNYDRRGRGDSGDHPVYDVQREVDDLDAVIERVGGPVLLFGMSSGAVLALEAVARGSAVSALALYEPPFVVDATRPPLPVDYVDRMKAVVARGDATQALGYFLSVGLSMPDEAIAGMRNTPVWAAWEAAAPTLPYDGQVMADTMSGRPLPPDRWRPVNIPVLVGHGSAGETYMANGAKELASHGDNYTLCTLPGQDHNVDPHALAPVLTAFFTGVQRDVRSGSVVVRPGIDPRVPR
ncbi:alpha/beta fold hydrolase [Streptomyces sp. NBC_01294]|uniref:alpha/beta fold hydrolase n=1 Tax=Streptomyces sp. NBC_01294 TaxID=2903815 RepID=UPI002DDAD618|nr:alpha/beta hydrolase [Streptomyces sp. NBC_01294]WRZ55500.1 alpha/beta hydrolase [Streptomyces sp. NBC_01294]WRZ61198.1 alpha/beta hydrolase [Streptomyces sp. NBC_01294]